MTDKELLYIEDALGHEQYFQQKCKEKPAWRTSLPATRRSSTAFTVFCKEETEWMIRI